MFDGKLVEDDKWLSNLLIARARWLQVPVEDVWPNLEGWRCGSLACFGGHCATWPEFRAQGVGINHDGRPKLRYALLDSAWRVADKLFGDARLFDQTTGCGTSALAHAEVVRRLDAAIAARRTELATVTA